jgi:phage tail-like protein
MTIQGNARIYAKKFAFAIEIDGIEVSWFNKCSEIKPAVTVIETHEGGKLVVANLSLGKVKWPPITLEVGMTDNFELYNWFKDAVDSAADVGLPDERVRKNLAIVQKHRDGSEYFRWNVYDALPSEYGGGEWDATAEETSMESMQLTFRYAERVLAT